MVQRDLRPPRGPRKGLRGMAKRDDIERLDALFRKVCASEARDYRKSFRLALKQGGLAYAIEQRAKAEVWETLANIGLPIVVEASPPPPRGTQAKKRKKVAK